MTAGSNYSGERNPDGGTRKTNRPRPLLMPAVAFIGGVWLSEAVGFVGAGAFYLAHALAAMFVTAGMGHIVWQRVSRLPRYRRPEDRLPALLIVLAAGAFGFARHQAALHLPPEHVAHFATDEPFLTRLEGRIVTRPVYAPPLKRNPFLPHDPAPRVSFVAAARRFTTSEPAARTTGLVRVSVEAETVAAGLGDFVELTGKLYRPLGPRNPGETDWARWNRLQHVYAAMKIEDAVHVRRLDGGPNDRLKLFAKAGVFARSLMLEPFGGGESDRTARLIDALVLGQRSAAGREINDTFLRSGALHFLAVSGFHVGVLLSAAWLVFRRLIRLNTRMTAMLMLLVLGVYLLVVEHHAPVLRAATMGGLLCLALMTRRPFSGLNWLALSALCILACDPFELFRAGFQLSFVQVLVIMTIVPRVYRLVAPRRVINDVPTDADSWTAFVFTTAYRWTAGLFVLCIIAWLTALPLVLYHFGRFAPWGAVQSAAVSPFVILVVTLGFLYALASSVPLLGACFGWLLQGSADMLLYAVDWLSSWPNALIDVLPPPGWLVFVTYIGAAVAVVVWIRHASRPDEQPVEAVSSPVSKKKPAVVRRVSDTVAALKHKRAVMLCVLLCFIASRWMVWMARPAKPPGSPAVCVLSVGDGLAVLVTTPEGEAMLYDCGTLHNSDAGAATVRAARALGVRKLDSFVISHCNFDHYSGVEAIMADMPPRRYCASSYFLEAARETPALVPVVNAVAAGRLVELHAGDEFRLGPIAVEVLWPPDDLDEHWAANDRSLVLRLIAPGRSILLTGDIEREALHGLLRLDRAGEIDIRADVLLAPHHGAVIPRDTEAFLRAVSPRYVVNSASRRRDKFAALIVKLFGEETPLVSTHSAGAVTIRFDGDPQPYVPASFTSSLQSP